MGAFRKAKVRIVLTKKNTIFGPGSKHPVRFVNALRDQIIDQDTDISIVPAKDKRLLSAAFQMCINAGHQTLGRSFFIAGSTIDLTCKEKVVDILQLERSFQLGRIEIVVFDCIGRTEDPDIFEPLDLVHRFQLDIQRQRGGKTLKVILMGGATLRFEEELVVVVLRKDPEFILDTGTVAGTTAADQTVEKRGVLEPGTEHFVHSRIGVEDIAVHLLLSTLDGRGNREERKTLGFRITFLSEEPGRIDRGYVDPRRSSGFHPVGLDAEGHELGRQSMRGKFAYPSSLEDRASNKEPPLKEGSGRQDNRLRMKNCAGRRTDARDF